MTFDIEYTPEAISEVRSAFRHIAITAPLNAQRWRHGLYKAVESLATFPERCPIAPDSQYVGMELRHLIYKSHRIIFWINQHKKVIQIIAVRHGAQRYIGQPHEKDN